MGCRSTTFAALWCWTTTPSQTQTCGQPSTSPATTHSDATIDALTLDAIGHVPWWPERRSQVTLHRILVHMIAETNRHASHADVVRELIDGAVGLRADNDNLPRVDRAWWESYRSRLERVAQEAGQG